MRIGVNGRFLAARQTGVQRFARELTTALAPLVDVVLFTPRGAPASRFDVTEVVTGTLAGVGWEQLELPLAARRAGLDVLLHPANAAPLAGPPAVQVVHDLTPLSRPSDFGAAYRVWARLAHAASARRAAAVVTVSEYSAREIERLAGVAPGRIHVVYQGVGPLDAPASHEAVEAIRNRLGLPKSYFLAVGVHDPRKGFAFLTRAFRLFAEHHREVELVGVGGRYVRVHRSRGTDEVRTAGHVSDEDLRALYTGAVALLFPSEEEGFGRPPLEAMACGTRVVVAPYSAAGEVLGDGADMVPRDELAWSEALAAVITEPVELRSDRVEVGRRIAARYTWEEAANRVVDICAQAARESNGVRR